MSSKLIQSQKPFFSKMVVDAVLTLDQDDLDESLIGVKKIPGGGMQVYQGLLQQMIRCELTRQLSRILYWSEVYRSRRHSPTLALNSNLNRLKIP
jgi:hypothetical protein